MANYLTNTEELTAVADAIREKTGESGSLTFPSGFTNAIGDISGGAGTVHIKLIDYTGFNPTIYYQSENGVSQMIFEPDMEIYQPVGEGDSIIGSMFMQQTTGDYISNSHLSLVATLSNKGLKTYIFEVTE